MSAHSRSESLDTDEFVSVLIKRIRSRITYSLQRTAALAAGLLVHKGHSRPLMGTIPSAARWVHEQAMGKVNELSAGETLHVPRNDVSSDSLPSALVTAESIQFPDLYAASLPNARILGTEGSLILGDRLVLDMSPHYGHSAYDHMALTRRRLPRPEHLDTSGLVLTGIDPRNHYHWLLDILPRYEVARRSGLGWDCVIATDMTPVHRACFDRLGIDPGSVIAPRYGKQFVLREAVVSTFPSLRYSPSPFAVRFVRELFADCMRADTTLPSRIYISRRECTQRRIHNEAEVEQMLSDLGFESVVLENLAFEEQVKLFANADFIVAPHGAGLANCAFCRPGTRLIEVFGKKYTPGFFRRLAAICNLPYACMVEGNPRQAREDTLDLRRDMYIDIAQLRGLVTNQA